jgi:hypothetical protein
MPETLQQITERTCVTKIKIMRNVIFDENQDRCYNCTGLNTSCDNYKPAKNCNELRYAHLRLFEGAKQ